MSNMTDLWLSGVVFFQALNTPKLVFGRGSAPDPVGGVYDAPRDLLVGCGGELSLPIYLPLDAFGVSISAPSAPRLLDPQHKFLATPMQWRGPNVKKFQWKIQNHRVVAMEKVMDVSLPSI